MGLVNEAQLFIGGIAGNSNMEIHFIEILNAEKYRLLRISHQEKKFSLFPYCNQCDQLLAHADALVYTNRHNLPKEVAVKMSNTDLYNLTDDQPFDPSNFNGKYSDGLVDPPHAES